MGWRCSSYNSAVITAHWTDRCEKIFEGVSKVRNPRSQQDSCALQLGLILDITNNTASVPDLVPAILDKAESWKDLNNFDEQDPEKPLRVLKRTGTYDFTGWLELSSARRLLFEQLRTHITFYVSNPAEGFNSKGLAELNSDVVRNVADELMQSPGGVLSLYAITQVWTEWKTLLLPHMHRWLSSLHRNTSAAFADLLLQGEGRQKYSAQVCFRYRMLLSCFTPLTLTFSTAFSRGDQSDHHLSFTGAKNN